MKILLLAAINNIHLKRWATFFHNTGHDIHVASFDKCDDAVFLQQITAHKLNRFENNKNLLSNFSLGSLSFNPINALCALFNLRYIIKRIQPDIVHGHSIILHTILGAFTGFRPFIVTPWGSDVFIYPKKSYIVNKFVKLTLNIADIITCNGNNLIEEINQMGVNKNKIYLIHHGTDIIKFSPRTTNNKIDISDLELRKKYDLKDIPTIISTRNLLPIYDIETLIRAIPLIKNEIPEFQVVIIGKGERREYLIDLAKELNVMEFVRFIGFIPNILITNFLTASDIYVSTSLSDSGLAASTSEAMSCSLPVIVTDFGDNRDWIEPSFSGYMFPAKDYEKLSRLIIKLIKNPSLRYEMGKNGRKKIMADLNYYKEMDKIEKLYKKCLRVN